jgi:integrase
MTKQRAKGEGTIYQRKDKRWVGMYTVNTLDGTKRRAVYGNSKKEVRVKLTEAISNRDIGLVFDAGNISVGEYRDRWLEAIQIVARAVLIRGASWQITPSQTTLHP